MKRESLHCEMNLNLNLQNNGIFPPLGISGIFPVRLRLDLGQPKPKVSRTLSCCWLIESVSFGEKKQTSSFKVFTNFIKIFSGALELSELFSNSFTDLRLNKYRLHRKLYISAAASLQERLDVWAVMVHALGNQD